jgi:hypothetical protein
VYETFTVDMAIAKLLIRDGAKAQILASRTQGI